MYFGLTVFLALKKIKAHNHSFGFSFFKSDEAFVAEHFSSIGSGLGNSSISSSSSSGRYTFSRSYGTFSDSSRSSFFGGDGASGVGRASGG